MKSLILKSDSYKFTHNPQYPKGTTKVISYLESRGGIFDNTVFYGLQFLLKKHFEGVVVTRQDVDKAKKIIDNHIGPNIFNYEGWLRIVNVHGGKIPIRIKAVPEGTVLKTSNVLMTVENTDEELPWITNFCESILLQLWYPITVSTLSREIKKNIIKYLKKTTSYSKEEIQNLCKFSLNDFGYRGASSDESAAIGGSAHIVNFSGSDNISAIDLIMTYYNTDEMLAFSIPASEHSTITSWGEENEVKAYENMLDAYPTGIRACVSDSYNILRACEELWGGQLRDKVLNLNGRLVIRPDSGDPVQTLKKVFNILWDKFGGRTNSKGFKVIDDHVRVIQGDGVNYESIIEILDMMVEEGFSAENIVFGMGGALLQKVDRDTQKFAFKCCSITINGEERDVQKHPLEVDKYGNIVKSFKTSKKGHLKLIETVNGFETVQEAKDDEGDVMVKVFENGHLLVDYNFQEIRQRAEIIFDVEELEMV
jgi:nicotinamide phosphoribosyltransferase